MSKRLQVLAAVKQMVERAVPIARVRGMDADQAKPETVGADGMIIVRSGDPGPAEVDLSPLVYHYEHAIPVELADYQSAAMTSQETLDVMMSAIGDAISADRTLGGLCEWLDAEAPTDGEMDKTGATPVGWADFQITASYSTTSPLG